MATNKSKSEMARAYKALTGNPPPHHWTKADIVAQIKIIKNPLHLKTN